MSVGAYTIPSKKVVETWAANVSTKTDAQVRVRDIARDMQNLAKLIRRGSQEILALESKWNLPPFAFMNHPISDNDEVEEEREQQRVKKWKFVQEYREKRESKKRKRKAKAE